MTSPIELSRTIRIRSSLGRTADAWEAVMGSISSIPRREPGTEDFADGVVLGVSHDRHPAATRTHDFGLGNAFGGVVGPLGLHVGANFADEGAHIAFGEDYDGVDVGQGSENLGALFGRHQGATFTLQHADGLVRIDGHDQSAAEFLGRTQVAHMAHVQEIEATVREDDTIAGTTPLADPAAEALAIKNLGWVRSVQWGLVTGGTCSMASSSSSRETVAVPRFITTMPPA